jgi:hypothetical protein
MPETLTLDRAKELLPQAVATQGPNFIYNPGGNYQCYYEKRVDGDNPNISKTACLVGVLLDLHGETRHHGMGGTVDALVVEFPDMMTEQAAKFLRVAQNVQDSGYTWGQAMREAFKHAENL